MRKTKIVCTIGPASESIEKLTELMEAWMNVSRLNFSHGDFEEHGNRIKNIREASAKLNKTVAILLDTKGPEIRTHTMENGANLAKLLSSPQTRRIGLVTSALHMPRSVRVFRKQFPNDTIVPIPVNHLYSPDWRHLKNYLPSSGTLAESACAIHEWIGMVWYVLRY